MENGRGASATSEEEREAEGRRRPINTAGRAHTHSSPNRGARHRRRHPPVKRRVFLVPLSKIKRNVSFWPPARKMPRIRKRRKRETLFYYRFHSFFDRCLRFDSDEKKKKHVLRTHIRDSKTAKCDRIGVSTCAEIDYIRSDY